MLPRSAVSELEAAIHQVGGAIEIHVYADTQHGFFNETLVTHNPVAAAAWQHTLAFLQQHLQP